MTNFLSQKIGAIQCNLGAPSCDECTSVGTGFMK